MNEHRTVPTDVLEVQATASDPRVSAWVAANAGSGKTHVLAQRVIRLLLNGCEPRRILCLTFTKAAAANMAKRVFDTLAKWTALDDAALDRALRGIGAEGVDTALRAHARRLFAAALETPGGLKVQTIHAFCTRLLHQFPFEANVAAGFTVLEERAEAELIDKLRLDVLLQAAAAPDEPLGRALATAITAAADQTFAELVRETIGRRDEVMAWVDRVGGVPAAVADLARALGIDPHDSNARIEDEILRSPSLPPVEWATIATRLSAGSKSDREQGARLAAAAAATGEERIDAFLSMFITDSGTLRKNLATKAIEAIDPALCARLHAERERVAPLVERRRAIATRDRTAALLTIAWEVIARYRAEKERRGLLDYDDLIDKTLTMLATVHPSWVHYKLDLGIDHVLIDEAQDTSRPQWEVIAQLVSEFTAGKGAREAWRSIFAVGDEKQSIFSFQGAEPHRFAEMRRHFELAYTRSGLAFERVDFKYSFRSAPVVLEAVDTVFGRPQAFAGLTADPVKTVHEAVRAKAPGLVELWPLVQPDEKREIEGWDAPFDTLSETAPAIKLARKVAARVKAWLGSERVADLETSAYRPVRPGDVLVLVRQRGALFEAVIRALKEAGIAVAGADRLLLTEHIAIMDLMVLADALLLPEDDLALATVLRSPLFRLTEEDLFELAWQRPGSLRESLRRAAAHAHVSATLDRWAETARREPPFAFYARVLGPDRGRARILQRLGPEAADALDEFLNLALDYETRETPSLQGFVASLRTTTMQVKRDMEIARDEVRVMTVHGAKGLEAPIVILADTTTNPAGPRPPRLLTMPTAGVPGAPDRLVWAARKETDVPPVAEARSLAVRAAEDEHRRLLYVAMTRAADRLIVCGAVGQRKRPDGCWYDLVCDVLKPMCSEEAGLNGETVWRLRKWPEPVDAGTSAGPEPARGIVLPDWLTRPAERERAPAIVAPSTAFESVAPEFALAGAPDERRRALVRGTLVHRLLQSLPDVAPERRAAAARQYLARAASEFTEPERDEIAAQVLAVLDHPHFVPLAAPGSRAEVPIVGRIVRGGGAPIMVTGQIDRLAVTDTAILMADYKTNRPVPRRLEDVPEAYLAQLALYREVLARLYPGRGVRAALVWTDVPDFMEISGATLDAALARIRPA
jgi:ATP-dependent helicase/nuclease subunit A